MLFFLIPEAVLNALDCIFNPKRWKIPDPVQHIGRFTHSDNFASEIDTICAHFGQLSTLGELLTEDDIETSPVDAVAFRDTAGLAKGIMLQVHSDLQRKHDAEAAAKTAAETKSANKAASATAVGASKQTTSLKASIIVNPVLKMAAKLSDICIGQSVEPAKILVYDSMFEFVEAFVTCEAARTLCPEWVLIALIAISIAVGTASPERAFSVLKIVKTRLRNRMSQPMLDALMRINLLLDFDELLDILPDFARKWITKTDRRANFGDGSIPEKYCKSEPAVASIFSQVKGKSVPTATAAGSAVKK